MELEEIKKQYLYMSNQPLFHVDYRVHPTEHINNYGFIKLMEDNKNWLLVYIIICFKINDIIF